MNTLLQDLRFGFRMMRSSPGFTLVAILVLMLGIGGTAAMCSIINTLVWRPILAKNPTELVRIYSKDQKNNGGYRGFSYLNYADIRRDQTSFTDVAAFTMCMVGLNDGEMTRRSFAGLVSANYFDVFGVTVRKGRGFLPEEEKPGSAIPVVIVSHNYWEKMGADPGLLGQTIRINSRAFTVIGVAPEHFTGTSAVVAPEFWFPLGLYEAVANDFMNDRRQSLGEREHHPLMLVARLKSGTTAAAAQSQLQPIASRLAQAFPNANRDQVFEVGKLARMSISTAPQKDSSEVSSMLLLGMSGAVLLIACFNLANMLLARSAARRKEIAVRLALGAGRARLVRQLLTEGLLLSIMGGACGLVLAVWSNQLLANSFAPRIPFVSIVFNTSPDWRVLLATFGVCLVSVLIFALVPAWKLSNVPVTGHLKEQVGEEMTGRAGRGLLSLRSLLVVGQLALCIALLTGAGLFAKGALSAVRANPGFSFDRLLLVETDASLAGYDEAKGLQTYTQLLERLRALPGVEAATLSYTVPFGLFNDGCMVERVTGPDAGSKSGAGSASKPLDVAFNIVGTDYFETLGLRLLRGREFDPMEARAGSSSHVAIIDEPLARKLWPDEDALGKNVKLSGKSGVTQVIGIVPGVRNDLTEKAPSPHVYVPFGQDYRSSVNVHLRLRALGPQGEVAVLKSVRETVRSQDPDLPIISVQTMRHFHEEGLMVWFIGTAARLFGAFGLLALVLAVVGVYGVNAYMVARRTHEIGIRVALGASTRDVVSKVLKEALILAAAGVAVGLVLALGLGFVLRSVVYDCKAVDPVAFIAGPLCLVLAVLVACYLPARRAAMVQPMAALRYE